jgi:xylan 1,4-beta-xylosidase
MGAVVSRVRGQIDRSPLPHLPLLWTEWNVLDEKDAREGPFVGPAVASVIRQCDGKVDFLSFWTFSEVFEEGGPSRAPFTQFGIRAMGGINKAAFYDFALLHGLGEERIPNPAGDVLVTRRPDGSLSLALWNLVLPGETGHTRQRTLHFTGVSPAAEVSVRRVDEEHSNALPLYRAMGSPVSPTAAQVQELNRRTALEVPEHYRLRQGELTLDLGPNALLLVEIGAAHR